MNADDAASFKDDRTDFSFQDRTSIPAFGGVADPYDDDAASNVGPQPTPDKDSLLMQQSSSSSQMLAKRWFNVDKMVVPNAVAFNGNVQCDYVVIPAPAASKVTGGTATTTSGSSPKVQQKLKAGTMLLAVP